MIFHSSDRKTLHDVLQAQNGNKEKLYILSSEIGDLIKIIKNLEFIIEQLSNDFENLKSKMKDLEGKIIPKLCLPPSPLKPPKKK